MILLCGIAGESVESLRLDDDMSEAEIGLLCDSYSHLVAFTKPFSSCMLWEVSYPVVSRIVGRAIHKVSMTTSANE